MRADLTLVVSPLVSLMQDQVEALERVAPGRVALVNAQQDARDEPRGGRARGRRAARASSTWRPSGSPRPASSSASGTPGSACSWSTRRTACRSGGTTSGRTTSAWRTRPAGSARRPSSPRRPRPRRRSPPTSWPGSACATRCTSPRASTARTSPSPSCRRPTKEAAHRGIAAVLAEEGALPAIVYAGTRAECDRLSARLAPTSSGSRSLRLPRGHAARRARGGPAALHGRRGAGGRGHERVRHGRRQGRRADGLPRVRARLARGLLPGGRPRAAATGARPAACCSPRRGTRGCTSSSSSARRSRSRRSRPWRAPCSPRGRARRAGASTCRSGRWRPRPGCDDEVVRAIVGHLARVGVVQPAPAPPDRVLGRVTGAWDGRALALCRSAAQEGTRARWRQYRAVWAWVEERRCRREGILRHFGDTSAPAPDGPCCDVCDPGLLPAPPPVRRAGGVQPPARAPPGGRGRRRRRWTRPSSRSWRSPARRSAAPAPSRCCAAVAPRSCSSTAGTGSRTTARSATSAAPRCSSAWMRCSHAGTITSSGGRYPVLEAA